MAEYRLDFDVAYQVVAPQSRGYRLVGFDRDFTHTLDGAEHPADLIP